MRIDMLAVYMLHTGGKGAQVLQDGEGASSLLAAKQGGVCAGGGGRGCQ
jgi:hypothetical protein